MTVSETLERGLGPAGDPVVGDPVAEAGVLPPTSVAALVPESTESPAVVAERHMARKVVVAIALLAPLGAVLYALLVLLAVRDIDGPIGPPLAAGACVGALAGVFAGVWVGTIIGGGEFEEVERRARAERFSALVREETSTAA